MKKVNQAGSKVLEALTAGLGEFGHRKIGQPSEGFMPVSVEHIGGNRYSVAHYYEQNGDLMADPEMVFLKACDGWYPVSFKQDNLGIYRESVVFKDGQIDGCYPREQADEAAFAGTWMRNIKAQQAEFFKPGTAKAEPKCRHDFRDGDVCSKCDMLRAS